jgi:hypothetical protein
VRSIAPHPVAVLTEDLRLLAQALEQLDDQNLELVVSTARRKRAGGAIPWKELRKAAGIAPIGGGNAVEDCDALYDDC